MKHKVLAFRVLLALALVVLFALPATVGAQEPVNSVTVDETEFAPAQLELAQFVLGPGATIIDFDSDPTGSVPNGFTSDDSLIAHFSDSIGANLYLGNWSHQSDYTQGLAVYPDGDASHLIIQFDTEVKSIALDFGNDDPGCWTNPGDYAELRLFDGAVPVGTAQVTMNLDDIMNQKISFVGPPCFDQVQFEYVVTGCTGGLIEIVDNIEFEECNNPPTADPNGPYAGDEGSPIPLDGTGSSDPDGDPLTYAWSVDDSSLCSFDDAASPTPNLTCADNGDFTVTLTVSDGDLSDSNDAGVTVANVAPSLLNVSVTSPINENGTATLSGDISDPSIQDTFTLQVDWGDGSPIETFNYDAGTTAFAEDHEYLDDNPSGTSSDDYTINLYIIDDDDPPSWYGNRYQLVYQLFIDWTTARAAAEAMAYSGCAGHLVTITSQEEQDFLYGEFGADLAEKWYGGFDTTLDSPSEGWQWVTGEPWSYTNWYQGEPNNGYPAQPYLQGWPSGGPDRGKYWDDNNWPVHGGPTTGYVVEYDCGLGTASVVITVNNVPPEVTADPSSQTCQYSDYICDVTYTATDVAADTLTASFSYDLDGGGFTAGLPDNLTLTPIGCTTADDEQTCTWTLSGIMDEPAGVYTVRLTVSDDDLGVTDGDAVITVVQEDADIWLDSDNPVAVEVDSPGGDSPAFSLTAYVKETDPDTAACGAEPGDISKAEVEMTLSAVGPGGSYTVMCTPVGVTGSGYDAVLEVICDFDDVDVNTYHVQATVVGDYYVGGPAEGVLVVYDPSLGFTTGGGWFYWPGTTDKTNFGYTMKYNKKGKKVQGNLLLIRHTDEGNYRVKSNALYGLSLGESDDPAFGWASFSGKCTYKDKAWEEPEGNHEFLVYVEDWGEPAAGVDQFWIEVRDKDGNVITEMSMDRDATDNTEALDGGNIVVPHTPGSLKSQ